MSFMNLRIYKKGALYSADCSRCGCTNFTHEWVHDDHNDRRDAMQAGTLRCADCSVTVDPDTFMQLRRSYAGRYSADGYMDCTDWSYSPNVRTLRRDLIDMYGEAS